LPFPELVSPQCSPTGGGGGGRQKIRRQSTAYEECILQKGGTAAGGNGSRRGSRPFLSPGDTNDDLQRGGRRDSLSPDSANEDLLRKSRRDSSVGMGAASTTSDRDSRESSPKTRWRRMGRRKSSGTNLEDKFGGWRKTKPGGHSYSPDSGSSREPSPKFNEGHPVIGIRRQSTTDEILIARGFRRESRTEDLERCRNFRRQSSTADLDPLSRNRGRRDSACQISDGQVNTMTIETTQVGTGVGGGIFDSGTNSGSSGGAALQLYENSNYHEECLKCNSCGVNLTGPNQKRARRFKNQILCDLHFADMALMESSDFMQQLRNFKAQSLGCAVARRKSSTTLIFPLPPQACSDEFCEYYPHNLIPNPGYWIECSRVVSATTTGNNNTSAQLLTLNNNSSNNLCGGGIMPMVAEKGGELREEDDEEAADEQDNGGGGDGGSRDDSHDDDDDDDDEEEDEEEEDEELDRLRDHEGDNGMENYYCKGHNRSHRPSLPVIQEPSSRKKTAIEEHWAKYGSFELTSVVQETHEKYFYSTEHWNYFTNDEDLGPVILSLKQVTRKRSATIQKFLKFAVA
jgi:hypothetical protein